MLRSRTLRFAVAVSIATCLFASPAMVAFAAPPATQSAATRARLDRAIQRLEAARKRADAIGARLQQSSDTLDAVIAEQTEIQERLNSRSNNMYRSGNTTLLSFLLGASTFKEFSTRWDLLVRMNMQDAEDLRALGEARARAESMATSLLELQASAVSASNAVDREVARARKEFAANQAALDEYRSQAAKRAGAKKMAVRKKIAPVQRYRGVGAWKTAVASHYGRNFTGRGASGERIGPYSMIVAHKTLPFGTLIEFQYNGKRAVARVADRGPHVAGRTFDLGPGVVRVLGFEGVHKVQYRIVKR